ncbi:acetyl esterase/lipase [Diaminobutyricimonas aerilata]|uniref:Acetyl esterase/lipase n=1 Tax=Diaminobutyricimonas aerilata TaxID=1162967 RepID=A0A2M9CNF7_9MICO|nr:acetyl esterase/lipase [Diaminobutyricimonas aerilata]
MLALGTAALLGGCAVTGPDAEVTPTAESVYPQLRTYPDVPVLENVRYGTADEVPLLLDVCLPEEASEIDDDTPPRPAIVSVHGGSWARGDKANLNWRSVCQWLASEGFVAASVNYRLAPTYTFPAQIDDVRQAIGWLREPDQVDRYAIDPDRIALFGGSAGGNLAALLGTEGTGDWTEGTRVAAVAELSGPVDLTAAGQRTPDFEPVQLSYLGCPELAECEVAHDASPYYAIDPSDPPFFVGHSVDERIPVAQSEQFVKELRRHGVDTTFVTVEGTMHSIAMLDDPMRERIIAFYREKLADPVDAVVAEPLVE